MASQATPSRDPAIQAIHGQHRQHPQHQRLFSLLFSPFSQSFDPEIKALGESSASKI